MRGIAGAEGVKAKPIRFGSYNVPSERNEDRLSMTVSFEISTLT